jgi:hypothetical protein
MGKRPAALYALVALGLSLASPAAATAVRDESGTQKAIGRMSAGGVLVPVRDGRVGGGAPAPSISRPPTGGGSVYHPAPPPVYHPAPPPVYRPAPPPVYRPAPPSVYRPAPPNVYRPVTPPRVYRPAPPIVRPHPPAYRPPSTVYRHRRHGRFFVPGLPGYDGGSCYWKCRSAGGSPAYCRAHAWDFCY